MRSWTITRFPASFRIPLQCSCYTCVPHYVHLEFLALWKEQGLGAGEDFHTAYWPLLATIISTYLSHSLHFVSIWLLVGGSFACRGYLIISWAAYLVCQAPRGVTAALCIRPWLFLGLPFCWYLPLAIFCFQKRGLSRTIFSRNEGFSLSCWWNSVSWVGDERIVLQFQCCASSGYLIATSGTLCLPKYQIVG